MIIEKYKDVLNRYYETILDKTWGERKLVVGQRSFIARIKRYSELTDAREFCTCHSTEVYKLGGALFVAFTAPVVAHTPESAAEVALSDIHEPPEWYVEAVLIPQITFTELLLFLDWIGFGFLEGRHPREKFQLQADAKELLRSLHSRTPFGVCELASTHIACKFLKPLSKNEFERAYQTAMDFNEKAFSVECSDGYSKAAWRKADMFYLGHC